MSSPTSDVSIDDGNITVTSGLYDTDDGIKLQVAGDTFPRLHLTPQGDVKSGDGTVAPRTSASGEQFVYDSDGTAGGNVYTDWATLLEAVAAVEGDKSIYFVGNETLPTDGMPTDGWNLDGAVLTSEGGNPLTAPVVTFPDGCKLDPAGLGTYLCRAVTLYSSSSSSVITHDSAGFVIAGLDTAGIVVSDTEAFFDVNNAGAYFLCNIGEGAGVHTDTSLTALGAGDIATGDHPVVKNQASTLCQMNVLQATATLATGTIEGAGDVVINLSTTASSSVSTTHSGVSGSITTQVRSLSSTLTHNQADTGDWTLADASTVAAHLDELAARVDALENP